jgi:hypothetical protein
MMAMVNTNPCFCRLRRQTGLRLTADKKPSKPKSRNPAGNIGGEASGNKIT